MPQFAQILLPLAQEAAGLTQVAQEAAEVVPTPLLPEFVYFLLPALMAFDSAVVEPIGDPVLFVGVVYATVAGLLAKWKSRSWTTWAFGGLIGGLLVLLVLAFLPGARNTMPADAKADSLV